ncbi:xanthine dehydrogenase family protein molybdopterin-binding subunit [Pleomorphochaeta sp. DL1XJH-081]|uniref:xanthine dehydrogenase family protein molybdopterin-binding subunit n=1 Tax=Pleomorphochaeta sp. DL1XJH-081 TaxID=3409690 RepID=UPI003BB80E84
MAKKPIGTPIRRTDALAKASGAERYLSDIHFEGMLHARMVRSGIPRGTIKNISLPQLPEGYHFITYKDIPEGGKNELVMIKSDYRCFAEQDVRYVGETIGLLVGPDRTVLADLLEAVEITYDEGEAAVTIEEGLACKGGAFVGDNNLFCDFTIHKGEIDLVWEQADRVVEDEIVTGWQEHVHLETNAALAMPDGDKFVIYASAQCPFYVRKSIAGLLGRPYEDVIVRQTTTGGAFGGKEHFPDVLAGPLLVAANIVKRPIQLIFDRHEDGAYSVKRHPSRTRFKTALDKDGNILGMDIDVVYNAGGYESCSYVVLQRGVFHATGVYNIPVSRVRGRAVATNTFPSDAFRGFGAPQTLFAIETHMCHLAREMGLDPLVLKERYFLKKGDPTVTNGHIFEQVVLPEMLDQVKKASDYDRKASSFKRGSGKGIGLAFYNHGGAFTGNGEQMIIKAKARLHKRADGMVEILIGSTEMGQGLQTAFTKIVADTLEIDPSKVLYPNPDTSQVADSGPTVASRSTMIVGKILERAAQKMKEHWSEQEDFFTEDEYQHPEGHPWNQNTFQGDAYIAYGWGICAVEVEVDPLTREVVTKGIWSSHDIGVPIDELVVQGQINGGIIQSLGYAAMEKLDFHPKKGFKQIGLSDYIIPTSMDFPGQSWALVENPYPYGPSGAKGMGELVFNGASAAFVDAVSRAIDLDIDSIPIPPETITELMA